MGVGLGTKTDSGVEDVTTASEDVRIVKDVTISEDVTMLNDIMSEVS